MPGARRVEWDFSKKIEKRQHAIHFHPSMRTNQKRVLIALGWYDYRLHRGIEKFAQEHHWHISANPTREKIIPWGWEGDGILAWARRRGRPRGICGAGEKADGGF